MKQLIVKAITYTGKYATAHKDGSTNWAQVSLWISDRFGLTAPKAARAWIIADRLAKFNHQQAGVIAIEDGVHSWSNTTDLVKLFQEIVNKDGPVVWERIAFDQQMMLVKKENGVTVPVFDDNHMPVISNDTEISYLANAAASWNRDDSYRREMLSWIPMDADLLLPATEDNSTENDNSENGSDLLNVLLSTTAIKSGRLRYSNHTLQSINCTTLKSIYYEQQEFQGGY